MIFQKQFLVFVVALLTFHLSTGPSHAADRDQLPDLGRPNELINQPVCWSAEAPDASRHCDFALRV